MATSLRSSPRRLDCGNPRCGFARIRCPDCGEDRLLCFSCKTREKANPYLILEEDEPFVPSKGWADMIRKDYETDPLLCPKCGGQMRILTFIEDQKVIDRIIAHLKLTFEAERPPPPQSLHQELLTAAEEKGEYF